MSKNPPVIRYPDAVRPWQHVFEPLYGYLMLAERLFESGTEFTGAWNFGPEDSDLKPVRWVVQNILSLWDDNMSWEIDNNEQLHEAGYLKLDCSKAKAELGWYPVLNLEKSLKLTIEWYKTCSGKDDMYDFSLDQIKRYKRLRNNNFEK